MHAVLRTVSGKGAKELFDLLEQRIADVENNIRSVSGFVSYQLVRVGDGGFSVSLYEDKASADEGVRKAREWIVENASETGASAPQVLEGAVILAIRSYLQTEIILKLRDHLRLMLRIKLRYCRVG